MAEIELMAYVNASLAMLMFSLMVLSVSYKFSDITILSTWADARSFSNSLATRAYSSADCFAYETGVVRYDEINDQMRTVRRVYPGVIDERKFNMDRYFGCIQSYFFDEITEVPWSTVGETTYSLYVIDFELRDLEDNRRLTDHFLSTRPQLDMTEASLFVETTKKITEFWSNVISTITTIADIALNIALIFVGQGADVSLAFKTPTPEGLYTIDTYLVDYLADQSSVYVSTVPVVIRYVDADGTFLRDSVGILKTTIRYGVDGSTSASYIEGGA
jgi:hypothetical protein